MSEKISAIIPTYNRADFVCRAVDSALKQTYSNVEVIVVDDGSTDATEGVLSEYGNKIVYIKQENGGVHAARNTGIEKATGHYIALLDSDDAWHENKLSLQKKVFDHVDNLKVVCTDLSAIDSQFNLLEERYLRTYLGTYKKFPENECFETEFLISDFLEGGPGCDEYDGSFVRVGDLSSSIFYGNLICTPTSMFPREVFFEAGGFLSASRQAGEDYDFFSRACQLGNVALIDYPLAYCDHGRNDHLSHQSLYMAESKLITMENILEIRKGQLNLPDKVIQECYQEAYEWIGKARFDFGDVKGSRGPLWKSIRLGGRDKRVYVYLTLSFLPNSLIDRLRDVYKFAKGATNT